MQETMNRISLILGLSAASLALSAFGCRGDDLGPPQTDAAISTSDGPAETPDTGNPLDKDAEIASDGTSAKDAIGTKDAAAPKDASAKKDAAPPKPDMKKPMDSSSPKPDQGTPVGTGAMIITEFFADPEAVSDTYGEFVELYNPGQNPVELKGWTLKDEGSNSHTITSSVVVGSKSYVVLGRSATTSANGGIKVDYEYSNFTLNNSDDAIILLDASKKEVDKVVYGKNWFVFAGYSTHLKSLTADNSQRTNWCFSGSAWSGSKGDYGSPGAPAKCAQEVPSGCTHNATKTIQFNPGLCPYLVAGAKNITLRNGHDTSPKVGDWARLYCTGYDMEFEALITEARHTTYGGITAQEYQDDGFQSQAEMLQIMALYYPGITLSSNATVFRWSNTTFCD
jgi:hypothetical protein